MEKNECLKCIGNYLKEGNLESKVFLGRFKQDLKTLFDNLKKNIIVLENDGTPQNDFEKEMVHCLKNIRDIIINLPISKNDDEFCRLWCEFVKNVNDNSTQNKEIEKWINFIIRLLDQHLTIKESIELLKNLNQKFRDMKNWMPPSFNVAKHYLEYLE